MSLSCLHEVLYVPQEVQDCHLLVHVTSLVKSTSEYTFESATHCSHTVTSARDTSAPYSSDCHCKWWCLYLRTYYVSTALYECSFIFEAFIQSNDLVSIAANRTMRVRCRTLARDDNTLMYVIHSICTQSYIHASSHTVIIQNTVHVQVYMYSTSQDK